MGKAKKRSIYLGKNDQFSRLTRNEAVDTVIELLKQDNKEAYSLITLFGLSAEELLEAGADYEIVKGMVSVLK